MKRVYACLAGQWACLNDDPDCVMGEFSQDPYTWYEEGADVYAPAQRSKENSYIDFDYVNIHYRGKDYRINPIFIQIVTD